MTRAGPEARAQTHITTGPARQPGGRDRGSGRAECVYCVFRWPRGRRQGNYGAFTSCPLGSWWTAVYPMACWLVWSVSERRHSPISNNSCSQRPGNTPYTTYYR
ncbi:hypothetical protein J4Q44_G00052880 [Coregonus suidteri]|uniref:Uncharacterized protein n=1 Tax=Coregonus suidteri TaxID=861788 RepID=A0AAN8M568_9TELE